MTSTTQARRIICGFLCLLAVLRLHAVTELEIPVFAGGYGIAFYEETARQFEQQRPDVRVRVYGDPRIADQLRIRLIDGTPPDAAAVAVQRSTPDAAELVSVAKSYLGSCATEIIQDCVQLHGGIGVTWEHDIHLYLRRATLHRGTYGSPEEHRERIAAILGMGAPTGGAA